MAKCSCNVEKAGGQLASCRQKKNILIRYTRVPVVLFQVVADSIDDALVFHHVEEPIRGHHKKLILPQNPRALLIVCVCVCVFA